MKFIFISLLFSVAGLIIWRWRVIEDSNYEYRRRYYEYLVSSEKHSRGLLASRRSRTAARRCPATRGIRGPRTMLRAARGETAL